MSGRAPGPARVMVAGPCRSGSGEPAVRAAHRRALNAAALALHRMGRAPFDGVNMALPAVAAAAGGEAAFAEVTPPLSLARTERCCACLHAGGPWEGADGTHLAAQRCACLHAGGPWEGADEEAERVGVGGRPAHHSLDEVPSATGPAR